MNSSAELDPEVLLEHVGVATVVLPDSVGLDADVVLEYIAVDTVVMVAS